MHTDQNIHQLIIRVFAEEANAEERQIVANWLADDAGKQKIFNELKEIWLSSGIEHNPDSYEIEKAIQKFLWKTSLLKERDARKNRIYQFARYAAILLLTLTIPVAYYLGTKLTVGTDTLTTITCDLGDKTAVVLPDSSRVILNSGSKLTFNNNFKNGSRQVMLEGEAYFSVRKDPRNPFRVNTSAIDIEVLGTEFNLKAYAGEATTTTTLVSGSLKVTGNNKSTIIEPSQKLIFDKESRQMQVVELADLSPETEWKDGRLVFRNQSLEELEHELERWFDVEIEFADEQVKNRRFTGTVERESILEVISYFERSKYVACRITNNVITFYTK
ncbi:FecR family protein [Gaoshiqia sp. Z1-71]|uniref:FecR family protein n=1 Tax=Gaoshiqia hydrogeniformans TaxID=3290090 RepID=UPI003BF7B53E